MNKNKTSSISQSINYWDLLPYLTQAGWILDRTPSGKFVAFLGPEASGLEGIKIVFPEKESSKEQIFYISNAVDILADVYEKPAEELAYDIRTVNKDILSARVFGGSIEQAIPLNTAAHYISELKQLVAYATRSELDRKPFYLNSQNPIAKTMTESYQFGHTFKGSFGFTIETPRLLNLSGYRQLSLLPELVSPLRWKPMERKVMERIARGLLDAQVSTFEKNTNILLNGFVEGLNANMCFSLASMLTEDISIEYSVKWANIKLPDDPRIRNMGKVVINKATRDHLAYAAEQLIDVHQQEVTISGLIIELSAKDSPMATDTSRTIRIQWFDPSEARSYDATATLSAEDYAKAIDAHRLWYPVEITGILSQKKSKWKFVSYTKFVTNPVIRD